MGAIGGDPDHGPVKWIFGIAPKTNKEYVCIYLDKLFYRAEVPLYRMAIVMDNHASHTSYEVYNKCYNLGVEIIYMPKYSCALNNVERVWSYVKKAWASRIAMEVAQVTPEGQVRLAEAVCREVAGSLTIRILRASDELMEDVLDGKLV